MPLFSRGVLLEQHKEPALSGGVQPFLSGMQEVRLQREPARSVTGLSQEEILSIAEEAGIIDEMDGRPLAEKLRRFIVKNIRIVAGDGIDDQPYISSQLAPLLAFPHQAAEGLRLVAKAIRADDWYFAVYRDLGGADVRIPRQIDGIRIERVGTHYPAQVRTNFSRQQKRPQRLIGVGALIAFYRAAFECRAQSTAFVTVAGGCVAQPANLEVSLGTPILQLLERCGLSRQPNKIIIGGSMTGITLTDPEKSVVTPSTRAVLAFYEDWKDHRYRCIGCGKCAQVCPQGLNPYFILRSYRRRMTRDIAQCDLNLCDGCGTCSYVCPARLEVAGLVRQAAQYYAARGIEFSNRQEPEE